ncbi:LytTR family DNA-binding domain-containing protein [Companilactobacillus kimchiensis]|uniref:HTH LytTR-type domain-containing protein n=1 Tax=Companilactobacillus kimchiensis TaxID=993692 RepID=A0A0R2LII2_9LACO|nr:LytTR family DNA-binding domain-containing protein [Companilactobacillus kimchiensis]KRN99878.1 hypothetical protein IV57_GL002210 [Companilactobacillus kimchiensis]
MKINYLWDTNYAKNEIRVQLHPSNQNLKINITSKQQLEVIDPKNQRHLNLDHQQILLIEAMDNLSKIYTIDNRIYYVRGRLKDLEYLAGEKIFRINNSLILNLNEVQSFKSGKYARLEVQTNDDQIFVVSRHYAKQIREIL